MATSIAVVAHDMEPRESLKGLCLGREGCAAAGWETNADLPAGVERHREFSDLRSIPGAAMEVVSEDAVDLWCLPGTREPSFLVAGERRPYPEVSAICSKVTTIAGQLGE